MAKIRHNNIIDTASDIFRVAKDQGVMHLYAQDESINGRYLTLNGTKTLHFGTCGYLSLEHNRAVKDLAIEAIERFGTQFPMSKTYISNPLYTELESNLQKMFNAYPVVSKNCTLSHLATIPTIIREEDAVILDHQVHTSVQEATQKLLSKGVKVEMIRHNNLEMLERTINSLRGKYRRIWYMADGVYSMYGDLAPIKELVALADKYEQFHLYVDDAHGTSWAGQNGTGYVMRELNGKLHKKMILTATMGKGFGACGGVTLFPNEEWRDQVKIFGGPLSFSVQLEPPILGAAIASTRIHLSEEIYPLQKELEKRIAYCNALIKKTNLPLVAENESPIFFIGTSNMAMTNRLIQRLINDGIYVNAAPFPAVPAKNAGVRFTISLNNQYEDIEELVDKMEYHFNAALPEVEQTNNKIRKAFGMPLLDEADEGLNQILGAASVTTSVPSEIKLEVLNSITSVDKALWNSKLGHRGMFDWNGMLFLEKSFQNNPKPEENWDFRYYIVKDHQGNPIVVTFCIIAIWKEDCFARASVSKQIEEKRVTDPYYLTSKAIVMGSMFTEGEHMYIDRDHAEWKKAVYLLSESLFKEQEQAGASNIMLRDFNANDEELTKYMIDQGFVKVEMPESCVIENLTWNTEEDFRETLSKRNKKHFKQEVRKYEKYFNVEVKERLSEEELMHGYNMFMKVRASNFALNSFPFPFKLFVEMNEDPAWEFLILKLKGEYSDHKEAVSIAFCHKNEDKIYSGMFVGMDYDYIYEYGVYRQTLYQTIVRAKELGFDKVNMGVSATLEKKKLGAEVYPRVAYTNAVDNFNMEMISRTMLVAED